MTTIHLKRLFIIMVVTLTVSISFFLQVMEAEPHQLPTSLDEDLKAAGDIYTE